eukprot:Rhum_TRINITY_DN12396_c0_g3::Rhum_TRINITY_DN12396_c0_g3_i1::g.51511::m.51511
MLTRGSGGGGGGATAASGCRGCDGRSEVQFCHHLPQLRRLLCLRLQLQHRLAQRVVQRFDRLVCRTLHLTHLSLHLRRSLLVRRNLQRVPLGGRSLRVLRSLHLREPLRALELHLVQVCALPCDLPFPLLHLRLHRLLVVVVLLPLLVHCLLQHRDRLLQRLPVGDGLRRQDPPRPLLLRQPLYLLLVERRRLLEPLVRRPHLGQLRPSLRHLQVRLRLLSRRRQQPVLRGRRPVPQRRRLVRQLRRLLLLLHDLPLPLPQQPHERLVLLQRREPHLRPAARTPLRLLQLLLRARARALVVRRLLLQLLHARREPPRLLRGPLAGGAQRVVVAGRRRQPVADDAGVGERRLRDLRAAAEVGCEARVRRAQVPLLLDGGLEAAHDAEQTRLARLRLQRNPVRRLRRRRRRRTVDGAHPRRRRRRRRRRRLHLNRRVQRRRRVPLLHSRGGGGGGRSGGSGGGRDGPKRHALPLVEEAKGGNGVGVAVLRRVEAADAHAVVALRQQRREPCFDAPGAGQLLVQAVQRLALLRRVLLLLLPRLRTRRRHQRPERTRPVAHLNEQRGPAPPRVPQRRHQRRARRGGAQRAAGQPAQRGDVGDGEGGGVDAAGQQTLAAPLRQLLEGQCARQEACGKPRQQTLRAQTLAGRAGADAALRALPLDGAEEGVRLAGGLAAGGDEAYQAAGQHNFEALRLPGAEHLLLRQQGLLAAVEHGTCDPEGVAEGALLCHYLTAFDADATAAAAAAAAAAASFAVVLVVVMRVSSCCCCAAAAGGGLRAYSHSYIVAKAHWERWLGGCCIVPLFLFSRGVFLSLVRDVFV